METQHSPPLADARPGRRRRWVKAFLIATVLAAGLGWYAIRRSTMPPLPPDPEVSADEPALAAAIREARAGVLKERRSAAAWGELGQVFLANELDDDSRTCFIQAERLDPKNPRWPYYLAGLLINQGDRPAALPYLQQAVERCEARRDTNSAPELLLAETLLAVGEPDTADKHYRSVLAREPDNPRPISAWGCSPSPATSGRTAAPNCFCAWAIRSRKRRPVFSWPPSASAWATRRAPTSIAPGRPPADGPRLDGSLHRGLPAMGREKAEPLPPGRGAGSVGSSE